MNYVNLIHDENIMVNESLLGGKGANLIRLARYGFKVPQGFVLNTAAYDLLITRNYYSLSKILDKVFPQKGTAIANRLMMGKGNITSAEHGYRLMELADQAKRDSEAMNYFNSTPIVPLDWMERLSPESPFRKAFTDFLKEFGHRSVYEGDISNPRWQEDPSYLLHHIQSILSFSDYIH